MQLATKFNVVFITVFSLGLAVASYLTYGMMQHNARQEVIRNAGIMMETVSATRAYTAHQVKPLLAAQLKTRFMPQSVPTYAARESFLYLRKKYPEYFYKDATLNPTNPRDMAQGWEIAVVKQFQAQTKQEEAIGVRDTKHGPYLYLGRPIRITDQACLSCHSFPALAPRTMLAIYGRQRGFGWQHNQIVGAQIVSIPMSLPIRMARDAFRTLVLALVAVFAITLVALNIMLRSIVVRPVTQLSRMCDEVSKGNLELQELPVSGKDEISRLGYSFNRMQRSLQQAMKMLDDQ